MKKYNDSDKTWGEAEVRLVPIGTKYPLEDQLEKVVREIPEGYMVEKGGDPVEAVKSCVAGARLFLSTMHTIAGQRDDLMAYARHKEDCLKGVPKSEGVASIDDAWACTCGLDDLFERLSE